MTIFESEIIVAKIMNRIVRLFCFLILVSFGQFMFGQNWNLTTVCYRDFVQSTGNSVLLSPLANDINLNTQPLSLKSVSFVEHGRALIIGNNVQFFPELGYHGLGHVIYTACDVKGNCGVGEISIMITDPKKISFSDTVAQAIFRNKTFSFYLSEIDFQLNQDPKFGKLEKLNDFQYYYIPSGPVGAVEKFGFSKGNKHSNFELTLIDKPSFNQFLMDDIIYLNKNTSRLFSVTKNDNSSSGALVITSFTQPLSGTLSLNGDNTFTYTSTLDFDGIAEFEYTACNPQSCETAKAYLYVSDFLPREDLNPLFRVAEGRSLVIPYDIPVQDYEFKILNQPSFGLLDFYKGNTTVNLQCESNTSFNPLVYTPLPGFIGTDHFIVNFCLTTGTKQCAPIKIKVETYAEVGCIPTSEFVWPGDANADGLVNLRDVNSISKFIGSTGPARPSASTDWANQLSASWSRREGINAKHADANGDGNIDQSDVQWVIANNNKSHKLVPQGIYQLYPSTSSASPLAKVIAPGDDAIIYLAFGNDQNLIYDVEAISFDLEYNSELIKPEDIIVEVLENSWFGYDNVILDGKLNSPGSLSVNFASSRGNSRNGFGKTVRVRTKGGPIVSHVEGFKIPKELPLEFAIKNIRLDQLNGIVLAFPDTKSTVIIDFDKKPIPAVGIRQYPNPASQYVIIESNKSKDFIERFTMTDLAGRIVIEKNLVPSHQFRQSVSHLQAGIYFSQVKTSSGTFTQKLEIKK